MPEDKEDSYELGRKKHKLWLESNKKRFEEEAEKANLILIGKGKTPGERTYRCKLCNNEQSIYLNAVRTNEFKCKKCQIDKLNKEAEEAGLIFLGSGKTEFSRTYLCKLCNTEQSLQASKVRMNVYKCETCQLEKLKEEAKLSGLTLIGKGRNNFNRLYIFNECKHKQECQVSHVRKNRVICQTCVETHYDLPSKIYLLEITVKNNPDFSWLKLGYARNVSNRIEEYGLPDNAVIKKLKVINIMTGREAIIIEKSMHTKYKRKKLPNSQMKKFHVFSGFSECYPMEMLDTLVEELVSAK